MLSFRTFRRWTSATVLLLASVLLSAEARSQDFPPRIPECKGRDLLADLKSKDPAAYDRWVSAASRIPNGEAILWRIDGNGLVAPSWLFGTIHLTDPRALNIPVPAQEAFFKSRILAVEIKGLESRWGSAINNLFALPLYYLPDNQTWENYLSKAEMELMATELSAHGYTLEDFKRWQPWAVLLDVLSYPPCEFWRAYSGMDYLDAQLAQWGQMGGMEVTGFETWYESARAIADMNLRSQFKAMLTFARISGDPEDERETGILLYLRRQVTLYFANEASPFALTVEELDALREFDRYTLDRRNLTMRDRALPLIRKGHAFIAVGAAHLPGDQGLVELFRKAGYEVTPVN